MFPVSPLEPSSFLAVKNVASKFKLSGVITLRSTQNILDISISCVVFAPR